MEKAGVKISNKAHKCVESPFLTNAQKRKKKIRKFMLLYEYLFLYCRAKVNEWLVTRVRFCSSKMKRLE